jgi:hypothetical protein
MTEVIEQTPGPEFKPQYHQKIIMIENTHVESMWFADIWPSLTCAQVHVHTGHRSAVRQRIPNQPFYKPC